MQNTSHSRSRPVLRSRHSCQCDRVLVQAAVEDGDDVGRVAKNQRGVDLDCYCRSDGVEMRKNK